MAGGGGGGGGGGTFLDGKGGEGGGDGCNPKMNKQAAHWGQGPLKAVGLTSE